MKNLPTPQRTTREKRKRPVSLNQTKKRKPSPGDHAWPAPSRPATRFCSARKWLGLLHPSPHAPSSVPSTADPRSRSRPPPVHAACATRDTSPVTGSVTDVRCVVPLLRVVAVVGDDDDVVIVALCASGGGGGGDRRRTRLPIADSAGETSPGLGRAKPPKRRSAEEMELECASDLRLLAVRARECSEAEFETGAEPAALSAECGLRCERIECSEPCSEVVSSRGKMGARG